MNKLVKLPRLVPGETEGYPKGIKLVRGKSGDIAENFNTNDYKRAGEICAKDLKLLFEKLKKENPMEMSFALYEDSEGKKLIDDYLNIGEQSGISRSELLKWLKLKLHYQGLKCAKPIHIYKRIVSYEKTDEVREKFVESHIDRLLGIFEKEKRISPMEEYIDIYGVPEGREIFKKLNLLLGEIESRLEKKGYKCLKPASSYFVDGNGAYFRIKFAGKDEIKESFMNERANACVDGLINIFNEWEKHAKENEKFFTMYPSAEKWNETIVKFLENIDVGDFVEMFNLLDNKLKDNGYFFTRPSYSYFPNGGGAWIGIKRLK